VKRSGDFKAKRDTRVGKWIAIGIAIGVAIGAMYDNIAVGIGIGIAIGISLYGIERARKR
jgi:hypothetical protein